MHNKKEIILQLRLEGKSYTEIHNICGASKGTISYHLGDGQKEKTHNRQVERRSKLIPLKIKIDSFRSNGPKLLWIPPINKEKRLDFNKVYRILYLKIRLFCSKNHMQNTEKYVPLFTPEELIEKVGSICYLTGCKIDLTNGRSYELDHIIPRSLGGKCSLDNCGLTSKNANRAKAHMTKEEFFQLCLEVVRHNKLI